MFLVYTNPWAISAEAWLSSWDVFGHFLMAGICETVAVDDEDEPN
ncbi:hypothetical protein [Pusillimonas sp. ANT_WB101]|nr:hypothetical protein [Pusillimonas sp. ANT_WB101]